MSDTSYLARVEAELENLLGVTGKRTDANVGLRPDSSRLGLLAAEAHRRELLTEGQLARMLRLDRVSLRKLLDDADIDD